MPIALPFGFDFAAVLRCLLGLVVVGGIFWVGDAIGDKREARVRAEFDEAVIATNVEIDSAMTAHQKVAAIAAAARRKAAEDAKSVKELPVCVVSPAQAEALNNIK